MFWKRRRSNAEVWRKLPAVTPFQGDKVGDKQLHDDEDEKNEEKQEEDDLETILKDCPPEVAQVLK
jgi:hypothetical protein